MRTVEASQELVSQGFSARVVLPWNVRKGGVLIVGEAPGAKEDESGVPFHPEAEAGGLLTRLLERVGVSREELTIANAVWQRPPRNELYDQDGNELSYTADAIAYYKPDLLELVEEMGPRVIIGLGKTALSVFTDFSEITSVRGYVHHSRIVLKDDLDDDWNVIRDIRELNIPFVGTYHPAGLNRGQKHLSGVFIHDVLVGLDIAQHGWTEPSLRVTPAPSAEQFREFCSAYNPAIHRLTYDIENPSSRGLDEDEILEGKKEISWDIDRMSFCYDSAVGGFSVPFEEPFVSMARELLGSAGAKRGHNCRLHDRPRLERLGLPVNGREYDTL